MKPADIFDRVSICHVAHALGVEVRKARCVAVWQRNADGWNVALSESKGAWFDHARGEGGGVLDFVQRVLGCDRRAALEWLAAYVGVPLDHRTEVERRDWTRRMRAVEPEARKMVAWKFETLEAFRLQRNIFQRIYHNARHFLHSHAPEECERRGDLRYEIALAIGETYWQRVEEWDDAIDRLQKTSYEDLLVRFRGVA